jgi:hypothetical protein
MVFFVNFVSFVVLANFVVFVSCQKPYFNPNCRIRGVVPV